MKTIRKLIGAEKERFFKSGGLDSAQFEAEMIASNSKIWRSPEYLPTVADGDYAKGYVLNGIELDPERELENILDLVRYYAQYGSSTWREADRLACSAMGRSYESIAYLKLALDTVVDPIGAVLVAGLDSWSPRAYCPTSDFVDGLRRELGLHSERARIDLTHECEDLLPGSPVVQDDNILCVFRRDLYFAEYEEHRHTPWLSLPSLECGIFYFRRDAKKNLRFTVDRHRRGEQGWSVTRLRDKAFKSVFTNYRQVAAKHGQVVTVNSEALLNYRLRAPRIPVFVDEIIKPFKSEDYAAVKKFVDRNDCLDLL